MAQLHQPFNAQAVDPTQGGNFSQLPLGTHVVVATASEVKANNANTGGMVVYELQVIAGPKEGATGPLRLNLYSSSEQARHIAEKQFSALCHATGVYLVQDTSQLHNIPFGVVVTEQPLTAEQQAKKDAGQNVTPFTQVSRILRADGSDPAGPPANMQQQAAAPAPQQQYAPPAPAPAAAPTGWAAPAPQQAPAPAPAAGGWGGAPAPAPAPAAGGWQQGAAAGNPAWAKK